MAINNNNEVIMGFEICKDYENGKMIYEDEFKVLENYLCGNINSDYPPNRAY